MNIVFDLGGVVFNWRPEVLIASVFEDAETRDLVRQEVIEHSDWVELDRGTISFKRAVERGAQRTGLSLQDIERLLDAVPPSLTPIEETFELIRQLSNTSNRLFVLSNMHRASIAHLERQYDIWPLFDGVVVSCRIQMVKPEREIFEHLLDLYQLEPSETVFIDDLQENLESAASMGIHTIRFVDPGQCRRALMAFQ